MSDRRISVRPAGPADLAVIAEVFRSASLHNERDRPLLLDRPELLELDAELLERRRVTVAQLDGDVVGFANTTPVDGSTVELEDLFVAPAQMRHGVGRALVADAVSRARADGATAITVAANDHALGVLLVRRVRRHRHGDLAVRHRPADAPRPDGAVHVTALAVATTGRLELRRVTAADADLLTELDADPEVMHFVTGGRPTSREEIVDDVVPAFLAHYARWPWYGFFLAHERATGEFVGWFHLRPTSSGSDDDPELGYRLRRSAWGRRFATEGSRALIDLAFARAGASRVHAETMVVHDRVPAGDGALRDAPGADLPPGLARPDPRGRARRRRVRDHP